MCPTRSSIVETRLRGRSASIGRDSSQRARSSGSATEKKDTNAKPLAPIEELKAVTLPYAIKYDNDDTHIDKSHDPNEPPAKRFKPNDNTLSNHTKITTPIVKMHPEIYKFFTTLMHNREYTNIRDKIMGNPPPWQWQATPSPNDTKVLNNDKKTTT